MVQRISAIVLLCAISTGQALGDAELFGIDFETGQLLRISALDASVTPVGDTGLVDPEFVGGLEFGPDGQLYAMTVGVGPPALYRLDPNSAAIEMIGPLGISFAFEGGLAIASDGRAWGALAGSPSQPRLLSIDLSTGAAGLVGTIESASFDVNGLCYRESDGQLIAIERANQFVQIDPVSLSVTTVAPLSFAVGSIGGLAIVDGVGYVVTGGSGIGVGTNELYSMDLTTGATTLIGSLGASISGFGVGGLAGRFVEPPPPECPGDLNGDDIISIEDLAILLSNFARSGQGVPGDLDGNGIVDISDLAVMLSIFGSVCD